MEKFIPSCFKGNLLFIFLRIHLEKTIKVNLIKPFEKSSTLKISS